MDITPPLTSPGYGSPSAPHSLKANSAAAEQQATAAEFLAIDDLLDFSDDDIGGPIDSSAGCDSTATSSLSSLSSELQIDTPLLHSVDKQLSHQNQSSGFDSSTLCVPSDDLAELEWLSTFVEESFSSDNTQAWSSFGGFGVDIDDDDKGGHGDEAFRTTSPVSVLESNALQREEKLSRRAFSSSLGGMSGPVWGRARSKRCRTAVCFWNSKILSPEPSESLLESSSTIATYTPIQALSSDSDMYSTYYDYDEDEGGEDDVRYRRMVKHSPPLRVKTFKVKSSPLKLFNGKHRRSQQAEDDAAAATQSRKCLHCGVVKTPQWRAGPMGPKTLCNACGVRHKSGRLCDEYRPAASPTFIESVHSNSHRKVMEMRRQRGVMNGLEGQRGNSHRLRVAGCERDHSRGVGL